MNKHTKLVSIIATALMTLGSAYSQNSCEPNWLSTKGNKLVDAAGKEVTLAGVNWSGFEAKIAVLEGLYARDMYDALEQIKDLGFNTLRIPWANSILRDGATYEEANYYVNYFYNESKKPAVGPFSNLELDGLKKPIEVLDLLVEWCQLNDMKIILDNHSRNADGFFVEKTWFTESTSEEQWIKDWEFMADRYKDKSAVIGMDINNEPNGTIDNAQGSRWGTGGKYDWRLAAEKCGNAILKVNPNVLIVVEGIEAYRKPDGELTSYWWGGNLQGVRDFPVRLSDPSKLMYSPHEYGPRVHNQTWFSASDFPENMPSIWEEQFNFLTTNNTSPLLIGELGIKDQGGKDEIWFTKFVDYIKEKKLHFTFWTFNPNSGDTGGILGANGQGDFENVEQWKMDYLKPILSQPIPNCINVSGGATLSTSEFSEVAEAKAGIDVLLNPSKEVFEVTSANDMIESVSLYSLSGKKVMSFENVNKTTLDLSVQGISNGVYIVKTIVADRVYTSKVIKN